MLRVTQAAGGGAAKGYFTESLDRGDYYTEGQELAGRWGGKAAAELGLAGEVKREDFFALCDNRRPDDGLPLTLRSKSNRRVGYDFNFHCPKDVSVVYALTGDEAILEAFTRATAETMADIEENMECRVRKQGAQEDRLTGNLAWSMFVHQTARPVGGVPDPHLHAHCFTFNATKDPVEEVWKAGQFGSIKKDAGYYEAAFHSRLRAGLEMAGYRTRDAGKFFELEGAPEALRERFSRRTDLIEAAAAKKAISDPARKGELGARTRDRKQKGTGMTELRDLQWLPRLSEDEIAAVRSLKGDSRDTTRKSAERAREAVEYAREHAFERESVVSEKELLTHALRHAGPRSRPADIRAAAEQLDLLRTQVDGRPLVTTREALAEERAMLKFARDGQGGHPAFSETLPSLPDTLSRGQRQAALGVLGSRDGVTIVRGGAGTGKTYMMRAVVSEIEKGGRKVFPVAPTTDAAHTVLRGDGFENAETVQRLLVDERLQKQLHRQVLWVDEAGLLGTRAMSRVFAVAEKQQARVILTGDDKQHGSVERGGPFGLLRDSGVRSVQLAAIRRQEGDYKQVVAKIDRGKYAAAFDDLAKMGWVKEMPQATAHGEIAREVRQAAAAGARKPLVIAPTHAEKNKLTAAIRGELRDAGELSGRDRKFARYGSLNLTEAQRKQSENYEPGQVIQFGKRATGFRTGQRTEVLRKDELGNVWVRGQVKDVILRTDQADRFDVFKKSEISVAAGDELRITRGGRAKYGKHVLRNGSIYQVDTFDRETGDIRLTNGWVLRKDFGHLDHAYVQTSFGTQGKTSGRVIVAQSAESFGASNAHQFYVSVSRGKISACVYTDDKKQLKQKIQRYETLRNASDAVKENVASTPARTRTETKDRERKRGDERERERTL